MSISIGDAATVALAVIAVVQGVVVIAQWRLRAEYASRSTVDEYGKKLTDLHARIGGIERSLDEQPDREEISRTVVEVRGVVDTAKAELQGMINEVRAEVDGVHELVKARIEDIQKLISGIGRQVDSLREHALRRMGDR